MFSIMKIVNMLQQKANNEILVSIITSNLEG